MVESPYATQFTRTGQHDATNRKPYRTKAQKAQARAQAYRDKYGVWHSPAPVSFH
jgi:hypothetical protein